MGIKVCMMTSVHPHNDVRIYLKESVALHEEGFNVIVLCSDYQGIKDGITFIKQPVPKKRWKRISTSWRRYYKRALNLDCDIYHIHDPELLPAAFKLKKKGKVVVYDSHENTPQQILTKPYSAKAIRHTMSEVMKRMEHRADKKLDLIISATPVIAQQFKNTITVCNYPIISTIMNMEYVPYGQRSKQACYCGSITENRGIQPMMEAAERSKIKLVLMGKFISRTEQNCYLRDKKHTDYRGHMIQREALKIVGQSRIGLAVLKPTLSYKESMPTKVFEYLACGVPVIASNFDYWKKIFGTKCCIFVPPYDVKAIAEAETYLIQNPDIAEKMGKAGRKMVLEKYCFEKEKVKLIAAYKKLAELGELK